MKKNDALLTGKEVTGPRDEPLCGIISISKDLHNLKKGYTHGYFGVKGTIDTEARPWLYTKIHWGGAQGDLPPHSSRDFRGTGILLL